MAKYQGREAPKWAVELLELKDRVNKDLVRENNEMRKRLDSTPTDVAPVIAEHAPVSQKTIDRAHGRALRVKRYMEEEYIPKDRPSGMIGGLTPRQKKGMMTK